MIPETVEASIQLSLHALSLTGTEPPALDGLLDDIRRQGGALIPVPDDERR